MAPVGTVNISWRNGEDDFCIAQIKSVYLIEEKCGCGIYEVAKRLSSVLQNASLGQIGGLARVDDIREVIRVGLMGGGKTPQEANKIIATCVDGYPLAHSVAVAFAVVQAYLVGVPDDPLGKAEAAGAATNQVSTGTTVASAAQAPTDSVPQ